MAGEIYNEDDGKDNEEKDEDSPEVEPPSRVTSRKAHIGVHIICTHSQY